MLNHKIIVHLETEPTTAGMISQAPSAIAIIFVVPFWRFLKLATQQIEDSIADGNGFIIFPIMFLTGFSRYVKKISSVVIVRRAYRIDLRCIQGTGTTGDEADGI